MSSQFLYRWRMFSRRPEVAAPDRSFAPRSDVEGFKKAVLRYTVTT